MAGFSKPARAVRQLQIPSVDAVDPKSASLDGMRLRDLEQDVGRHHIEASVEHALLTYRWLQECSILQMIINCLL